MEHIQVMAGVMEELAAVQTQVVVAAALVGILALAALEVSTLVLVLAALVAALVAAVHFHAHLTVNNHLAAVAVAV